MHKPRSMRRRDDDRVERGRIRPSANRQQELEVAILLLQKIDLLKVAIEVVADVVPRVALVVDVLVCPDI
jgi:hypothetical protein